ncbi:MAG: polysulfide reductase NrfD [Gammaproteobacteria bacterium]|nr:polysulfide reductase NrfD [Gammaproteobacteria bacterium]MDH3535416.1 polysulfide reductase NrfD [Gammaproteobacteria bacterium]
MQSSIRYAEIRTSSPGYWGILIALFAVALLGVAGAHHMDVEGHHVSGMSNQIVWGLPHVFAIFLIVAASGALNIASLASVFARQDYKPLARFSAILSVALLVGGLAILLLDLGRPERLIVAMTQYNFKSIFAWNIILYTGFVVIVVAYLWLMMERRMQRWSKPAGLVAFLWRLVLTTGTGSIFGFLVAREAFDSALLAPLFIIMSFAFGLAIFILLLMLSFWLDQRELDGSHLQRLRKLLGIFIAAVLYFVVVFHLTKLYGTQNHGFERFILMDGGIYTTLFWLVQIGLGSLLPLALIYAPPLQDSAKSLVAACLLVIVGAFAQLYIIIIGGQAYPLNIFPGYIVASSFFDGVVAEYTPSLWEFLLGFGGLTAALLIAMLVLRVLPIMPEALRAESG